MDRVDEYFEAIQKKTSKTVFANREDNGIHSKLGKQEGNNQSDDSKSGNIGAHDGEELDPFQAFRKKKSSSYRH